MTANSEEWLRQLAEHDPALAEKARRYIGTADPEWALSHAEFVRAVGIAGPLPVTPDRKDRSSQRV